MDPNAVQIQIPASASQQESSSIQDAPATKPLPAAAPKAAARPALSSASDLLKLLPTGTVLAFQALAPSFSIHGVCHVANRYLVLSLVGACAASCVLLSFTDSLVGRDGKLYHGAATFGGFYPFNFTGTREEREATFKDLYRLRITALDFVHAFFSALVFLAVALADASIQGCLFPDAGPDVRELLVNLPLGAGCPAWKSVGYADMAPRA
ncbi:uncharacterized protein C2845_PM07G09930 [Panicum miliaceum]|uniref:Uncharacterized protein n=1 Tax=Panicum miliaceum TaxID=4540 RepID=A0A3L6SPU0_PANMI|nr:uncharacterized protein C2845_PM07G09930 [Panicum miliaceum]